MKDILSALLKWAVLLSNYPSPDMPPKVEFKPQGFFVEKVCANRPCNVLGWYNDKGIVYFDERIRQADSAYKRSIWVHELVHYLQHLNGKFDPNDCADRLTREREAYIVQREYLIRAHGETKIRRLRLKGC